MLLRMTQCPCCLRKLPPNPRSFARADRASPVAHVRKNGTRCEIGSVHVQTPHDPAATLEDDTRWSAEFNPPLVRYIHHDRPLRLFDKMLEKSKRALLESVCVMESAFFDKQLEIVASDHAHALEYTYQWFDPRSKFWPPTRAVHDRDGGDEQPANAVTYVPPSRW